MNLFISSLILIFYVCGGMKLISPYKNNIVCIFLFNNADKNNDAGKNVMTETGVLPVNENTNQARANATN